MDALFILVALDENHLPQLQVLPITRPAGDLNRNAA